MLSISTTKGQIGIETKWGGLNIRQPKAEITNKTELPSVDIRRTQPKVTIDQKECFADVGLKSPVDYTRENAGIARQAAMKGIARRVEQGDQMMDSLHKGGEPIIDNADYNAFDLFNRDFIFGVVPKSRPKIDVIMGTTDIRYIPGKLNYQVKINKPEVTVNHGDVDIYMKTWPDIKIEFYGDKISTKL